MKSIFLKKIDKLHNIFIRLETITYLQTLARAEDCDYFLPPGGMEDGKQNAPDFLLDLQTETIADLRALLFSEPFCVPDMPKTEST